MLLPFVNAWCYSCHSHVDFSQGREGKAISLLTMTHSSIFFSYIFDWIQKKILEIGNLEGEQIQDIQLEKGKRLHKICLFSLNNKHVYAFSPLLTELWQERPKFQHIFKVAKKPDQSHSLGWLNNLTRLCFFVHSLIWRCWNYCHNQFT